jgi:GT2 family glycosyltransferase
MRSSSAQQSDSSAWAKVGAVVIGRNEGERLVRSLASVRTVPNRVYVDSGSTDSSVLLAQREGISVVELSAPPHFTAARARNAGIARLLTDSPEVEFVQMIDGDCEMQQGWLESAVAALQTEPRLALVFGRRRERYPERSIYNTLCDDEWNVPVGETASVGGDALFRVAALRQVSFYNQQMIAGEDPELAMRLHKSGWRLRRIDAEMTLHDAAMTRFGQWWRRTQRSGHAYGELAYLHPDARDPNWRRSVRSILFWAGLMPAISVATMTLALTVDSRFWFAVALFLLPWPLNMLRLARRQRLRGLPARIARIAGALLLIGKLPQFLGLLEYYRNRLLGRTSHLIEYKQEEGT